MDAVLERQEVAAQEASAQNVVAQDAVAQAEELQPAKKTRKKRSKRNDVIVTARVPVGIRDEGNAILKTLNATPTDLINAAYRYVIEFEELPHSESTLENISERRKTLTQAQKDEMRARIERMTPKAPASWKEKPFEELRAEAMADRYGLAMDR